MKKTNSLQIPTTQPPLQTETLSTNSSEIYTLRLKKEFSVTQISTPIVPIVRNPEQYSKGSLTPSLSSKNTSKVDKEKVQTT